jgi:uncharacterized NAD-dependent epimerase/dehydratase family protein
MLFDGLLELRAIGSVVIAFYTEVVSVFELLLKLITEKLIIGAATAGGVIPDNWLIHRLAQSINSSWLKTD